MTKLEILEGQFDRNKRHSLKKHRGKALSETGFVKGCYRCKLIEDIAAHRQLMGEK